MKDDLPIKELFLSYLNQLETILKKIPEELFEEKLHANMLPLGANAKVAANFILRGYYPLLDTDSDIIEQSSNDSAAVLELVCRVREKLKSLESVGCTDQAKIARDKAGFNEIELGQTSFVHRYIIPNFMFHMGMVYAIARSHGVPLSKGDFDGLHSYPVGFSFV